MKENVNFKRDVLENFEAQFKKSTLSLMILKILSEKEMYAYEITQVALERSNGRYRMPLLYTALKKLEEQGFVRVSRRTISEDNRARVYYMLTDEGITHLENLKDLYADLSETVKLIIYNQENSNE